jgi:hypothetical protein
MSGDSLHAQALRAGYHAALGAGLDPRDVGAKYRALQQNECPEWLARFLFQKSNGQGPDLYDAYALLMLCNWSNAGWLAFYHVAVGVGPVADRKVDENNARLRGLAPCFSAVFRPEFHVGRCDDGQFSWSSPLTFPTHEQQPGLVPFEVGTTASSRTILHLREDGGVARWAYDSNDIVLGVVTPVGRRALGVNAVISPDETTRKLIAAYEPQRQAAIKAEQEMAREEAEEDRLCRERVRAGRLSSDRIENVYGIEGVTLITRKKRSQ